MILESPDDGAIVIPSNPGRIHGSGSNRSWINDIQEVDGLRRIGIAPHASAGPEQLG